MADLIRAGASAIHQGQNETAWSKWRDQLLAHDISVGPDVIEAISSAMTSSGYGMPLTEKNEFSKTLGKLSASDYMAALKQHETRIMEQRQRALVAFVLPIIQAMPPAESPEYMKPYTWQAMLSAKGSGAIGLALIEKGLTPWMIAKADRRVSNYDPPNHPESLILNGRGERDRTAFTGLEEMLGHIKSPPAAWFENASAFFTSKAGMRDRMTDRDFRIFGSLLKGVEDTEERKKAMLHINGAAMDAFRCAKFNTTEDQCRTIVRSWKQLGVPTSIYHKELDTASTATINTFLGVWFEKPEMRAILLEESGQKEHILALEAATAMDDRSQSAQQKKDKVLSALRADPSCADLLVESLDNTLFSSIEDQVAILQGFMEGDIEISDDKASELLHDKLIDYQMKSLENMTAQEGMYAAEAIELIFRLGARMEEGNTIHFEKMLEEEANQIMSTTFVPSRDHSLHMAPIIEVLRKHGASIESIDLRDVPGLGVRQIIESLKLESQLQENTASVGGCVSKARGPRL